MFADGVGGGAGEDGTVGEVEGAFERRRPQPGGRSERQDLSFDRYDGGNIGLPFGSGDGTPGVEYRHGSGFVTVAFFEIDCLNAGQRLGLFANNLDAAAQGRLVIL